MMNTNRSKNSVNKSYELSRQFAFDPEREAAALPKLAKVVDQTKVYEFKDAKRYEEINRPFVGQQKRKMIEEKLQLDKTAQKQAIARIKQDNYFIGYERNPFIETEDPRFKLNSKQYRFQEVDLYYQLKQRQGNFCQKEKDIVKAINNISQKDFQKQSNPQAERWGQMQRFSQNNLKALSKNNVPKGTSKDEEIRQQKLKEPSFDDIVAMEEQSYYAKNQVEINIFQFLKGNHKSFLTNSILDKFYFCHISMMDRITTLRFPIVRDLSRTGRKFARDHQYKQPLRLQNINSNEMGFKVGEVKFIDLLSVASGRFTPQIVYKTANQIEVRDDSNSIKSQISQLEVNYRDNLKHKPTSFGTEQTEKLEIIDYLKLQNTHSEERYAKKCNKLLKYVESQMVKKANLTGNTIRDKQLHRQIDNNVNQYLQYMINMDHKKDQTQKIIRKNKLTKDRSQAIKIRTLLNSIVLKNREQQKMKILLQDSKR